MKHGSWDKARRILCVRLDNAGDVLMTAPALRALKQSVNGRSITLLCSSSGARISRLIPDIDGILTYDAPWVKSTPGRTDTRADRAAAAVMGKGRFDGAVIFTVYSQNPLPAALFCYLAGIPLRAAFCRENPYQLLTHWLREREPQDLSRHEVERQLALVSSLGGTAADDRIRIKVPDRAMAAARALLARFGIDGSRWIALHPGASAPSRRYPAGHFSRLCDLLADGIPLVFTGTREEIPLVEKIRSGTRAATRSLAGMTDMESLAAVITLSSLLISNNTCSVHLASAAGTPVVDLYALTNPQHTPWRVPSRVLYADVDCKYCYKSVCPRGRNDCLAMVQPEQVAEAARELLEGKCIPSE